MSAAPVPLRRRRVRLAVVAASAVGLSLLTPPPAQAASLLAVTLTAPSTATVGSSISASGTVTLALLPAPLQDAHVLYDGLDVAHQQTATDGSYLFTLPMDTAGTHTVQVVARPGDQLEARSPVRTIVVPEPVRPPVQASPVTDPSVSSDIAADTAFLYQGSNPPQTGVASGTISPVSAAVLRGLVLDAAGNPLPMVKAAVAGHPEYGSTLSRSDGSVNLAVNGGQRLTVSYSKPGYLPIDRTVDVAWRDYTVVDDVTLSAVDSKATAITSGADTVQVVRAHTVTDSDGTRTATLLFPAQTHATMTLPDGSQQYLADLTVRATEYTVGPNGQQSMPGDLPNSSAYTYAVDYTVDQALAADATRVTFDQPLAAYTENFLGIPVGLPVPAGYYNSELHAWVPQGDGVVLKIVSITSGKADVDVTGDGSADTGSALTNLGITDSERTQLANLYSAGTSLWRVPISHFTPWDFNYAFGLLTGDTAPNQHAQAQPTQGCETGGSIIGCSSQTLGEALPVVGTDMALRYDTSRMPGFAASRTLNIGITGATVPARVQSAVLEVDVAGTRFTRTFTPSSSPALGPNLRYDFTWDGKDVYGRVLQGAQTATIKIGYAYQAVYYAPRPNTTSDNGRSCGTCMAVSASMSFMVPGSSAITGDRTRNLITVWQQYTQQVGGLGIAALGDLGGWTLTGHNAYDPDGRTLYLGDGTSRQVGQLFSGLGTLAGTGSAGSLGAGTDTGDGGPATSAGISRVNGLAAAPDGTLYLADSDNGVIRKITPSGIISTVAGGAPAGSSNGDGGPARSATLDYPVAVVVTPTGSLLIADAGAARIRKVAPDGTISTFAGGGAPADGLGDHAPATGAALANPRSLALGPDGTVYVADTGHDRVRSITPNGVIQTVAGGGAPGDGIGDGVPGPQAQLATPMGVAMGPHGELYIADTNHNRLRLLGIDGLINSLAGTGVTGTQGDGGLAATALLDHPTGLAVDPQGNNIVFSQPDTHSVRLIDPQGIIRTIAGTGVAGFNGDQHATTQALLHSPTALGYLPQGKLVIADTSNYRVRVIASPLPGFALSDFYIPSSDGSEVYQFNASGRHLRTLDALTGRLLLTFGYDGNGRLLTVNDYFGTKNSLAPFVTINRDAKGDPTGVDARFGQHTTLRTNAAGYLDQITDPANQLVQLAYYAGGLLSDFTDARNNTSHMLYDGEGRLSSDTGPDQHATTLARTVSDNGTTVTSTTAEGRVTSYYTGASGSLFRGNRTTVQTVTAPDGTVGRIASAQDGTIVSTGPDGTVHKLSPPVGDPRFGLTVPLAPSATSTTPGGVTTTTGETRAVTLSDPDNPLSVTAMTTTITTNGRSVTGAYTAATRTATTRSPSGITDTVVHDADGLVASSQHGSLAATSYTYDTNGRVLTSTVGSGSEARTTTYTYGPDGLLKTVKNSLNQTVTYIRDAIGRVTDTELPDGSHVGAAFDKNSNLTSLTAPGRPAHSFDYTSGNQVQTDTPPAVDAGDPATRTLYNKDRQATRVTLPDGTVDTFGYDSAGRLSTTHIASGDITLGYDPTSGALSSAAAPGVGSLRYGYDGSLLSSVVTDAPVNHTVSYAYSTGQLLTSRSVSGGASFAFGYDGDGLISSLGALTYTRDTNGLPGGSSIGGGSTAVTTSTTPDNFAGLQHHTATVGTSTVYDATYTPDALGRVASRTETVSGNTSSRSYTYDSRGGLTDVRQGSNLLEHYTYDANGNRLGLTTPAGTVSGGYDNQDRLTGYGTATYTYNARGDLHTKTDPNGTTTYTYDELGHLTHVVLSDARTLDYTYDALGRRTSRALNGTVTAQYLYGSGQSPVALLNGSGTVQATYGYGRNGASPDLIVAGGTTYRVLADQLGSPRLIINTATGTTTQSLSFGTFGQTLVDTNPGFQPFGYTGGLTDPDTGLIHLGARDLDPTTGRFTTKDPTGILGSGTNAYLYVDNDPINGTDPSGLHWWGTAWDWGVRNLDPVYLIIDGYYKEYQAYDHHCPLSQVLWGAFEGVSGMAGLATIIAGPLVGGAEAAVTDGVTAVTGDELAAMRAEFNSVRASYWRTAADSDPGAWSPENLARMQRGRPPIGDDGYPMELHHKLPLSRGGSNDFDNLQPMTRTDHRLGPNYAINHPG